MNTPTLPDWYANPGDPRIGRGSRRSGRYIRKSLREFAETLVLEFSISSSRARGALSRLDPRAKVLGILALIISVTLTHGALILCAMLGVAVGLALVGGVSATRMTRIWLGVPIFTAAIALPAVTNLVTPGSAVLTIWDFRPGAHLGPWMLPNALTVTGAGLLVAARFLLRATTCVTLSLALAATTDHPALMNALRRLGLPKVFGMTLSMTQRYLGLCVRSAEEIHLARMSRTIAPGPIRGEYRWIASGMGSLFRRTRRLAEDVHDAMVSRGYDGDLRTSTAPRFRVADAVWLIASLTASTAVVVCDRLLGGIG